MITENKTKEKSTAADSINRKPIVAALIIGAFIAVLNETLLHIAFPDLMKQFSVPMTTIQWLATIYMLVVGTLVPITALLQQWFTTRQMFLTATILFLIGTFICGFAPSFPILMIGRAVQAIGTGLMLPVLMTTMMLIFPPERRGSAMGIIGLVIMFAPAIGPVLSGLIIDTLSWRWLFYLVALPASLSVIFATVYLKNVSEITKPRFDYVSIFMSILSIGGLVYGFSKAAGDSFTDSIVLLSLAIGTFALIAFVWRQITVSQPILELRAFRYPMFSISMILLFLVMMVSFAVGLLLSQFMLYVLSMNAFAVGLCGLLPGTAYAAMSLVSGKLCDKIGTRSLIVPGFILIMFSLWFFTQLTPDTTSLNIIVINVLLFAGLPMVLTPAQTAGLNSLPRRLYPHGAAIMNTFIQIAGAVGIAIFIGVVSKGNKAYLDSSNAPLALYEQLNGFSYGIQHAFWFCLIIGMVALIIGFFIKRTNLSE